MAEPARAAIGETPLYERDYALWAEEQGRKLSARSAGEIDWNSVAEEIESYPAEILAEEYGFARSKAIDETRLPEVAFPVECPFAMADILDQGRRPE